VYKRDIRVRLLLLRAFFLFAVTASVIFFHYKRSDYGFVIATLLVFASIIPITKLKIEEDSFTVVQYYLFGFIPRRQVYMKGNNISIYEFDISFSESDLSYIISGSFLDLLLTPTTLGTLKRYAIEQKDFYGDSKEFKMKLSEKEYALIKDNFVSTPLNQVELSND
jgi:hypothetical protein